MSAQNAFARRQNYDAFSAFQAHGPIGRFSGISAGQSTAVLPGDAATPEVIRHREEQERLISLLHRFLSQGPSWTVAYETTISPLTANAAELFIRGIPARKKLPKISPDGEGGLMMVWEWDGDPLLVTIDDLQVSAVVAAATPRAEYLDRFPAVDGPNVPATILKEIPNR